MSVQRNGSEDGSALFFLLLSLFCILGHGLLLCGVILEHVLGLALGYGLGVGYLESCNT